MADGGTAGYVRRRGLTIEQQNAIDLLVTGITDAEAGAAVGVSRVTVSKSRTKDPFFQAELNRRRAELWAGSVDRLRNLLPAALDALEQEIRSGKNGWRAALEVVRVAGLDWSKEKTSIGSYLVGPTSPESIVDSLARARRPHPLDEFIQDAPVSEEERSSILAELERELADGKQ
jgi:hypothetical protein